MFSFYTLTCFLKGQFSISALFVQEFYSKINSCDEA